MIMKTKLIHIIFIIVTFLCLYSSIRVYRSFTQQYYIIADFNNQSTQDRPDSFINAIESDYPNLSLTGIPLKTIRANYYFHNDSILKGLDLLQKDIDERSNPYIMYSEATKAKLYAAMGLIDSARIYSRKAFNGLPKNPFHFAEFTRILAIDKEIDSIAKNFEKIKDSGDGQIWRVYLSSVVTFIDELEDKTLALQNAEYALKRFESSNEIRVIALYVLYGRENTVKALDFEKEGLQHFNNKEYVDALEDFKRAYELTPLNRINQDNIAFTYFNLKNWDLTSQTLNSIENSGHILNGYQNYMYGLTLINLVQYAKACKRFNLSNSMDFTPAKEALIIYNCITSDNKN